MGKVHLNPQSYTHGCCIQPYAWQFSLYFKNMYLRAQGHARFIIDQHTTCSLYMHGTAKGSHQTCSAGGGCSSVEEFAWGCDAGFLPETMDMIATTRDAVIENQENQQNAQQAFMVLELNASSASIVVVMILVNQKIQSRMTEISSMIPKNCISFAVGPVPFFEMTYMPIISIEHNRSESIEVNRAIFTYDWGCP